MALRGSQYSPSPDLWAVNRSMEDDQSDVPSFKPHRPWAGSQPSIPSSHLKSLNRSVFDTSDGEAPSVEFLTPIYPNENGEHYHKPGTQMPAKLPPWAWTLLSFGLGVNPGIPLSHNRLWVSTFLHVLTLATAFCYGACGLVFNIYDVKSAFTETSALLFIAKLALGTFWIFLGTSSHSLAAKLCSSRGLLDYIRFHSKTFMKISSVAWISCLAMVEMGLNFYSNAYLLQGRANHTEESPLNVNCPTIGLPVFLCHLYFVSKIVFSFFSLAWNLIVAAVCLSVCRTHTKCIRRFLKELAFDSKIYEEFYKHKHLPKEPTSDFTSDVIKEYDLASIEDEETDTPFKKESVWQTLWVMRQRKLSKSTSVPTMSTAHEEIDPTQNSEISRDAQTEVLDVEMSECRNNTTADVIDDVFDSNSDEADDSPIYSLLIGNEDFSFTYFTLLKHLRSTSHLLQRWISSMIFFVCMWCAILIIYWVSHTAKISDVAEFLIPIIIIGILTSAYAEVNFEGSRVIKFLMPTEERMSVIYYAINMPLTLKAYSYVLTYNILVTVVAAVALTLATSIILKKIF